KESIGWRKGVGIGLSVAGLLVLHAGSIGEAGQLRAEMIWGSLLVLGAVCCEAAYTLLGRVATEKLSAIAIAGVTAAGSLVLFGVPAAIASAGVDWADVPWQAWAAAAWWGAGTLALGSVLWYRGVSKVPGS